MKNYIVELENNVWIAEWTGDPGRTLKKFRAKKFNSLVSAGRALKKAQKMRPFINAKILEA